MSIINESLDGKRVKIKMENFSQRNLSPKFRKFLEKNSEKVFTAMLDGEYKNMYVFKEDRHKVKWLFHEDDLAICTE